MASDEFCRGLDLWTSLPTMPKTKAGTEENLSSVVLLNNISMADKGHREAVYASQAIWPIPSSSMLCVRKWLCDDGIDDCHEGFSDDLTLSTVSPRHPPLPLEGYKST